MNLRLSLDKLEGRQLLGELIKADANCPHINEVKDGVVAARQLLQDWDAQYGVLGQYIQKSSTAYLFLKSAMVLLDYMQNLMPGNRETTWEVARRVVAFDVLKFGKSIRSH